MSVLTLDELKQKGDPAIKLVFSLSVEYLIAGVCKEYSHIEGIPNVEEFNKQNLISPWTLASYPFFISLANGHSQSLYTLFGEFYSTPLGPVSLSVFNLISSLEERSLHFFDIGNPQNEVAVVVKDTHKSSDFAALQELIKNMVVNFGAGDVPFSNVRIERDRAPGITDSTNALYAAINGGIQAIVNQSNRTFFNGDPRSITFQASYFHAFKDTHKNNQPSILEYSQIENPKRRPFYQEKVVY